MTPPTLTDKINAVLPQTQCRKCGYDGCRPYAAAIADNQADINRCPPGGHEGIVRLADVTGRSLASLPGSIAAECGTERPRPLAIIDESACIGCTLCIQACPVDAIIGAPKQMHAIIDELCTGCDLCVEACPVDCISMSLDYAGSSASTGWAAWSQEQAHSARQRFERREKRLQRNAQEQEARLTGALQNKTEILPDQVIVSPAESPVASDPAAQKKAMLQAAMQRARQKRLSNE